ncbi:hypothetical protein O181_042185 [Austropuccinia psidii MF-1]|uniref:PCI domain-containing protein n=1 Tax=Austropuccinia psidii MF-1 TaxID=1389203 RepID=A0A9Q3DG72_9BASI|nr:hypothetical protein [Austropuccinia psidii MF-1]
MNTINSAEIQNSSEIFKRISNYSGKQLINRLCFLAQVSVPLSLTAYDLAIQSIIENTWNVRLYQATLKSYNTIACSNGLPSFSPDELWIQNTQSIVQQSLSRLETDLKNFTNNLLKDNIRITYQELGAHYRKAGDHINAQKAFSKAREHTTNPLHIVQLAFQTLDLAFDTHNLKLAHGHISKVEAAIQALIAAIETNPSNPKSTTPNNNLISQPGFTAPVSSEKYLQLWNERVKLATGLLALAQGDYSKAAHSLLKISRETSPNRTMEVLATPNDIAVYTTLCSLASFDRQQLKERVIENAEFRSILDTEPQLRNILNMFRENQFKVVLQYLHDSLPVYRTDIYIADQIDRLISIIQERAIMQYFAPFSSARLSKASEIFGWSIESLQDHLADLIQKRTLSAKLDLDDGVLITNRQEIRPALFQNAIQSAEKMELETKAALLRLRLISGDIVVKDNSQSNAINF